MKYLYWAEFYDKNGTNHYFEFSSKFTPEEFNLIRVWRRLKNRAYKLAARKGIEEPALRKIHPTDKAWEKYMGLLPGE